jgi:hypothetical protein
LHLVEERTRFGALDDAMVIGTRDGYNFGDTNLGQLGGISTGECGRIVDGAQANDGSLGWHEPGNGVTGTKPTGVRNRHGHTSKIFNAKLVDTSLGNQRFVSVVKLAEGQCVGVPDARHHQAATAIGLLHIDGNS